MLSKAEKELQNLIDDLDLELRTKKAKKAVLEEYDQKLCSELAARQSEIKNATSFKDKLKQAFQLIDKKKQKSKQIIEAINKIPDLNFKQLVAILDLSQLNVRLNNPKFNKESQKYFQELLNDKIPKKEAHSNRSIFLAEVVKKWQEQKTNIEFYEKQCSIYNQALKENQSALSNIENEIEKLESNLQKNQELATVQQQNKQEPKEIESKKPEVASEYQIPVESKPSVEEQPAPAPVVEKPAGHERPDNNKNDKEDAEFAFKLKRAHIQKEFKKKRIQFEFNEDWASQFKAHWNEKLDEYWEFRCNKYRIKDKISKSDKANREGFIADLKMALVNYKPETNTFRNNLNIKIQHGIDNYTPGLFSNTPGFFTSFFGNKADDYMNLRGLLTKMKQCLEIIDEANKMDWSKMTKNQHLIQP